MSRTQERFGTDKYVLCWMVEERQPGLETSDERPEIVDISNEEMEDMPRRWTFHNWRRGWLSVP